MTPLLVRLCPWIRAAIAALFGVMVSGCQTAVAEKPPMAAAEVEISGRINPFTSETMNGAQVATLDLARVTVIPVVRRRVDVRYPAAMRRNGVQGQAVVDFIVDEEGQAREVYAIKATNADFAAAAVASVSQWIFSPGTKDGRIVRTHMQVPIDFSLDGR